MYVSLKGFVSPSVNLENKYGIKRGETLDVKKKLDEKESCRCKSGKGCVCPQVVNKETTCYCIKAKCPCIDGCRCHIFEYEKDMYTRRRTSALRRQSRFLPRQLHSDLSNIQFDVENNMY